MTSENLELRCRAHNAYQAEQDFGRPYCLRETPSEYGMDSVWTELASPHVKVVVSRCR